MTLPNEVGVWTGTDASGEMVVVTSLEVHAILLFCGDAARSLVVEGPASEYERMAAGAAATVLDGMASADHETIARALLVAKARARAQGVAMPELVVNGDKIEVVPTGAKP